MLYLKSNIFFINNQKLFFAYKKRSFFRYFKMKFLNYFEFAYLKKNSLNFDFKLLYQATNF